MLILPSKVLKSEKKKKKETFIQISGIIFLKIRISMLQRSSSKALYLVAQMQKHTVISTISRLSSELANPLLLSRWSRGSGSGLFEKTRSTTLAWLHVRYREIIASQFVRNGRAFRKRKCRKPEAVRTDDDLAREMLNNQTRICEFFHFSDISIRSIFVNR